MFESLASCFAFRCSAPLNMTVPNRVKLYGALALGVLACFTSSFGFLPSSDIR